MRNLRIISYQEASVEGDLPLTATAWDTNNDSIICAFGPTLSRPIIEIRRKVGQDGSNAVHNTPLKAIFSLITSWDAPCPLPELECDEILLMHYFPDTSTICLVLAGGDLILVREEPENGQEKIEIVGSIDIGITAAAWAPDEELLAIVTRSESLVLMSRDLEPITETTMTAEDLQASKHISVGWGKKETQFQGKRAKALRDPTMPEHVDEGLPSPLEDSKVSISWRGDGAYLAVNALVTNHRRVIRVYSREAVLDSVSEPVDWLESANSWKPSGSLIASVQRRREATQSTLNIVFFERNGLRHGEFALHLDPAKIEFTAKKVQVHWNIDSSVLAVSLDDSVQFWTVGNYHYYLKQEVKISGTPGTKPVTVSWHPEKPLKCCINTEKTIIDLDYIFHTNRGSTIKPYDHGAVAVIDGAKVKFTPLKQAGVPPPMAFSEISTSANIIDVATSKDGQRLCILTANGIQICDWKMQALRGGGSDLDQLRYTHDFHTNELAWSDLEPLPTGNTKFTQVIFRGNEEAFVLAPAQKSSGAVCFRLHIRVILKAQQATDEVTQRIEKLAVPEDARLLITDNHQETVWIQTGEKMICVSGIENSSSMDGHLAGPHSNSALFQIRPDTTDGLSNGYHSLFHKISLTTKGALYVNQRALARDCTSFVLTDLHLIYTTTQHLLKFVHLTSPDKMEVPGDTPEIDERCRSIERGAIIVTVIPSVYAVVLQMPRGNLETIYPRVLVLTGIRESLRNLEYRTSFLACQNHQVDMNILHDYLPTVFMANIKKFIDDLKKPSRVDEFLSKLKEEDVTQTLYKDTLYASADSDLPATSGIIETTSPLRTTGSDKVNRICDAFISILKDKPGTFLQCIITAHVCKRPPDLAAALMLVSSLRQNSSDEADLAVSHLCFLTDTNRLFDAALALYDLELTLLVAQNAQRDPREYMPFLQNLQSLPVLRRQYQIDNHLRNYSKALDSLHALQAHDEVETYTIKHGLYTHAMDLYRYSPSRLTRITTVYADHLSAQSQHSPAAILYESLSLYAKAYPLYALAHQWRESLTCATLIPLPKDQLHQLALGLATTCADESHDYRSAAAIHTDYLSDPSTAAKLLCKGSYFADATRLLSLHNLSTEIPSTIDTGLGEKFSEILELVTDCKAQLSAQIPRILELRIKKAEDPLAFYGGDAAAAAADGVDIPDNISLAPTDATTAGGQSLFTRYGGSQGSRFAGTVASNATRKTSKTKRREERKRARGKKGSVYEEEYLVGSVARLIGRVNGVHEEVGRLVGGLLRRGMRERAVKVGEIMAEIGAACEKARREVWGGNDDVGGEGRREEGEGESEWRPSGADGVFWDSQQSTLGKAEKPVVKQWKGSVLVLR